MRDKSACKEVNGACSQQPVTPDNEEQIAERQRWIANALEDDEVHEALSFLRVQEKARPRN